MEVSFASRIAQQSLPKQIQKKLRPSEISSIDTLIFTENERGEGVIEIEARGRGLIFTWQPIEHPNPNRPEITHCWELTEEYDVEEEISERSGNSRTNAM
jgi:hypothetical protein